MRLAQTTVRSKSLGFKLPRWYMDSKIRVCDEVQFQIHRSTCNNIFQHNLICKYIIYICTLRNFKCSCIYKKKPYNSGVIPVVDVKIYDFKLQFTIKVTLRICEP